MTVGTPLSSPGNSPGIGDQYFEVAWVAFFDDVATTLNAAAPLDSANFTGPITMAGALTVTGLATFDNVEITGTLAVTGAAAFSGNVGFYGISPGARPHILGGWGGNTAGYNLCVGLASIGIIDNSTAP